MRVMVFAKANRDTEAGVLPTAKAWEQMERFSEELAQAGIVEAGEGLLPSSQGVRMQCSGQERQVTNGPFADVSEIIAGYSIWQVASMEEAIAWAKRCPLAEGGEIEIRPIFMYSCEEVSEIMAQPKEA